MSTFFKRSRQKLMNAGKMGTYLKYAVGEIVLVVIGILIAVTINNLNEQEKQKQIVNNILSVVANEMKSDTVEINRILNLYDSRYKLFLAVINDSLSEKELILQSERSTSDSLDCAACFLITRYKLFNVETKGYAQLKGFAEASEATEDSLVIQINHFYSVITSSVDRIGLNIGNDVTSNLRHWRDHYPWFTNFVRRRHDERLFQYISSDIDFKNRVSYHYILIYDNYVKILESYQRNAKYFITKINKRLEN